MTDENYEVQDQFSMSDGEIALLRKLRPGEPMPVDGLNEEAIYNIVQRGFATLGQGTIVLTTKGRFVKGKLPA